MTHPSVHARTMPEKIAYRMADSGAVLTYGQLNERSNKGAHLFRSLGLSPGDHIALLLENSLTFLEICWAAQRSGLYYTAISRYLTANEIAYIVDDCGAKVFITSPDSMEAARDVANGAGPGIALFVTGEASLPFRSWEEAIAPQPATPISDETAGFDMLYSSGTTGRPKGVKQPFKEQPITVPSPALKLLCADMCGMGEDTVYLSPAPLYHAAPLRFNMMVAVLGGTSVIMNKFDAENISRSSRNSGSRIHSWCRPCSSGCSSLGMRFALATISPA